jgi:hypothetical protein
MARRGDGIYLRKSTWWLDFTHRGQRHVVRLGSHISRTVAKELSQVERARVLRGEAGIGGPRGKDPLFADAAKEFVTWVKTNRKARTAADYEATLERLKVTFAGRRLEPGRRAVDRAAQARAGGRRGTGRRQPRAGPAQEPVQPLPQRPADL